MFTLSWLACNATQTKLLIDVNFCWLWTLQTLATLCNQWSWYKGNSCKLNLTIPRRNRFVLKLFMCPNKDVIQFSTWNWTPLATVGGMFHFLSWLKSLLLYNLYFPQHNTFIKGKTNFARSSRSGKIYPPNNVRITWRDITFLVFNSSPLVLDWNRLLI